MNSLLLAAILTLSAVPSVPEAIPVEDFRPADLKPIEAKFNEFAKRGDKEIVFVINSFGGSVFDGKDLVQSIESTRKRHGIKTVCIVDSRAMSMGFYFLQSTACEVRLMTKRSMLLAHNAATTSEGHAAQLEADARFLRVLDRTLVIESAARMGMSVSAFEARIAHADWVFGYEEALKVNAVDGTATSAEVPPLAILEKPKMSLFDLLGLDKTTEVPDVDLQPSSGLGDFPTQLNRPGTDPLRDTDSSSI